MNIPISAAVWLRLISMAIALAACLRHSPRPRACAEEHPRVFTAITVEHTITGRDLQRPAVERALDLSRTRSTSVSAMLGKSAVITHMLTLVEAPASTALGS
jgi:hypothetical protein